MIYISAVGMINATGNNLDEIATNLTRGVAPGMRPRAGWLQASAGGPGWRGWRASAYPEKLLRTARATIRSCWRRWRRSSRRLMTPLRNMAASALRLCLVPAPPACMKATRTLTCAPTGSRAPHGTTRNRNSAIRRVFSHWLALDGPAYTLSTACSSSARAIISGRRLIEAGLVDAAIVGGADTLSRMPINGFHSLESLSPTLCQPFGRDRAGITIGEGAGLMLLTWEPQPIALLGVGESSDAYHISAPHPQGEGAIRAINQALTDAQLTPDDVGYINLHGTATQLNDQIESMVVNALFGERVPCSSTKHLTGHTLGTAGITRRQLVC